MSALGDNTLETIYPLLVHYGNSIGGEILQRSSSVMDLWDKD